VGSKYFGNKHDSTPSNKKGKRTVGKKSGGKKVGAGVRKVGRGN